MSDEFYGFDNEDFDICEEGDVCEHGVGFDCNCAGCENDPIGCVFPGRCLMPGEHVQSECHTAEMLEEYNEGAAQ